MATVVILTYPTWVRQETTTEQEMYYTVYDFGVGENTECTVGGQTIDCQTVLEQVKYGVYDVRIMKPYTPIYRKSVFRANESEFGRALIAFGVVAAGLAILSK